MHTDISTGEIITLQFKTPFNHDTDAESNRTATYNEEPTMTQQQFKEECDINVIMERFGATGELPTNIRQPITADFVEAMTFHEAQNALLAAQESFMELPAQVRARFENDPAQLIEYMEADLGEDGNAERRAFAEKYGLTVSQPTETPAPSSAVSPGPVTSSTTTGPGDAPKA